MIVPEQVKLPLLSTAAAHGADETVPPPMMLVPGSDGAAETPAGEARAPVRAATSEATTMRMRTPDSFRGCRRERHRSAPAASKAVEVPYDAAPRKRTTPFR